MDSKVPDEKIQPAEPQQKSRGFIYRISNSIDNFMRSSFFKLGLLVANNPLKVMLVSIIFLGITLIGILRFRSESREDRLWIPTGTTALQNQNWANSQFGRTFRFTTLAFQAKDSSKGIANKAALIEALDVIEKGYNLTAGPLEPDGEPITFEGRCIQTTDTAEPANNMCRTISVFNMFYDVDKIVRRQDQKVNFFATVKNTLNALSDEQIVDRFRSPPKNGYDGSSFIPKELYAANDASVYQVIRFIQLFENNAVDEDGASVDEGADEIEEVWTKYLLEELKRPGAEVNWFVDSGFGQGESLSEALSGDLPLLSFGFILLGVYVVFFMGDWHAIRAHRLLGLGALATTGLALGSCFGVSSAFGMFFGPVHQILPLLIIGIGCDDCFHIARATDDIFNREDLKEKSVPTKVAMALSQSGAAITVTSFTNVVVFLLSGISRLPALRFFSLWAAIGVFLAWVYAITFFAACVTLDMRRVQAKRFDCIPCFPPRQTVNELNWFKQKPGAFSRFFENYFGPFILRNPVRIIILVLFAAGFGASIYGCTQLYLKFRFAFFYPSGTSQREYQDLVDEYFELGDPTSIYIRNRTLSTIENQKRFLDLCHSSNGVIAKDDWIQNNSVSCWYQNMLSIIPPENSSNQYYEPSEFITTVKAYTVVGSAGNRFANDIIWDDEEQQNQVIATRFSAQYVYRESNVDEINGLKSVRESADSVGFGDEDGIPAAFPYAFQDTFSEQYDALPSEIGLSLGLASAAVALVCLILVGHPVVAAVSVLVVGIIIIGVLGLTYYTDINLNSVSVITLVLCTGISVDFVVHIARAFLEHVGTRKERAIKALAQMGPPVWYAGFSTFLAIIVLAGAKSYIFKVLFFGFFFLIILAFLHGLILGPVILSFIGPPSFYESEEEKESAERELEERFVGKQEPVKGTTEV